MRGKKNMHREIQIKQFPIVTTHWWPKTQNERFVWENEQYLYCFLPLVHNHVQVKWVRTHIRCVTCVCARSGSRLTEGVSEAWCWGNCHRSCRFWTVYSRIMMTYFKQTRLLSSLYLYTSAPCIRFIHLEPGTVYWDMTPTRKKKRNLTFSHMKAWISESMDSYWNENISPTKIWWTTENMTVYLAAINTDVFLHSAALIFHCFFSIVNMPWPFAPKKTVAFASFAASHA